MEWIGQYSNMILKTQILNRLKEEGSWICGAELERIEWRTRKGGLYKPSSVGRCLRELTEFTSPGKPKIAKWYKNGTVFYFYIPSWHENYNQQQLT